MYGRVWTGLVPVFVATFCGAQPSPSLTEAEFLSVLDENHPVVREAAEAVALAEADVLDAETLENPTLGIVREGPLGSSRQTDVLLSWQLPGRARSATVAARARAVDAARARYRLQLVEHRHSMREAYAAWAIANDRVRRLTVQAERVASLAKREAARSAHGEASGLDAHRLRLAVLVLQSRVALAAADRDQARAASVAWAPDLSPDTSPILPTLPPVSVVSGPAAEVEVAREAVEVAELGHDAARRFVSTPELTVGWQHQEVGPEVDDGLIAGLSWSLPLFNRKRAERIAAAANIEGARARLTRAEQMTEASRVAARDRYAGLSAALAEGIETLAKNERMLDGAEAAFVDGELGLTELLETLRSVGEAELAMLDVHETALAALRDMERLGATAFPPLPLPSTHDDSTASPTQEENP